MNDFDFMKIFTEFQRKLHPQKFSLIQLKYSWENPQVFSLKSKLSQEISDVLKVFFRISRDEQPVTVDT